MTVRAIIAWSRSGGTLITRCMGALPDSVVLSEVSPGRGSTMGDEAVPQTPADQARAWYGIELEHTEFLPSIRELAQVCRSQGKALIVNLWCVGEFSSSRQYGDNPPRRLLGYEMLKEACPGLRAMGWIRDPIDIWISQGCRPPDKFFPAYLSYLRALLATGVPIFTYEEFCRRPDETFRRICADLEIEYSSDFTEFSSNHNVLGDRFVAGSRGFKMDSIAPLPRKRIASRLVRLVNQCESMKEANRLAGYDTRYGAAELEPVLRKLKPELQYWLQRVRSGAGL